MFNERIVRGLKVPALCLAGALGVAGSLADNAAAETPAGLVGVAAVQLAAQSDVFGAASAGLKVVQANMAGSCPRTYMLQVNLGAFSPGTLGYQIETLDGRVSQTFKARTEAQPDGSFAATAAHPVHLAIDEDGAQDPARVVFSAPARPAREASAETAGDARTDEPGLLERLFGTPEAEDPSKGLSQQSFRVRVVAPNEVASPFDALTVTCTAEQLASQMAENGTGNAEDNGDDQRDGKDHSRDDNGRDGGRGRDTGGRGSGGSGGSGGGSGGSGGAID